MTRKYTNTESLLKFLHIPDIIFNHLSLSTLIYREARAQSATIIVESRVALLSPSNVDSSAYYLIIPWNLLVSTFSMLAMLAMLAM